MRTFQSKDIMSQSTYKIIETVRKVMYEHISITPDRAAAFFKTGKGDYAEGVLFMGLTVPQVRIIAKQFSQLTLDEIQKLLQSDFNEERLLALIILVTQYQKADALQKEALYEFYLKHRHLVNNWNLVDSSAHLIVGAHVEQKDRGILVTLAQSENLWDRRIAIIATLYFIRHNDLAWTFTIARVLLHDTQDLIHKAVGWMLREAGKKNQHALIHFLDEHATVMPRTMLRYALEKLEEETRKSYLKKNNY